MTVAFTVTGQVVSYVCELLRDKNAAIRAQADRTLFLIHSIDLSRSQNLGREPQWAERIKHLRSPQGAIATPTIIIL